MGNQDSETRNEKRRGTSAETRPRQRYAPSPGLAEREALLLSFQRAAALDAGLPLLEFSSLAVQLLLHFAVAGVELLLALLQLALLLGYLLLEHHLHLGLHLGKLLLVEGALLLLLDGGVDLLEDAGVLRHTHGDELVRPVVLVQVVVRVLLELLHVSSDKHLPELNEVAVVLVIHLNNAPRVASAPDLTTVRVGNLVSRTNDGERDLGHDLVVLGNGLLIVKLIPGALEDLDAVILNVGQDLCAEY